MPTSRAHAETRVTNSSVLCADARSIPLRDNTVDLCVTSPPYWRKRDYSHRGQLGQEPNPQAYVKQLDAVLVELARVVKPTGSLFLNIGDSYYRRSLAGIPFLIEQSANAGGWLLRNRITWVKDSGLPSPKNDTLKSRYELVLHLTRSTDYFFDLDSLRAQVEDSGDVWRLNTTRNLGKHLAPFPFELPFRAIAAACPEMVCVRCGEPRRRVVERDMDLDPRRQQARRALELFRKHRLTRKHLAAIRATGISDAGKAKRFQNGAGRNSHEVLSLAAEAKKALGGYFREFTFAKRKTVGYTACTCRKGWKPGLVLDVFAGTGTTLAAAAALGRNSIGFDLAWKSQRKFDRLTKGTNFSLHHAAITSRA